MKHVLLDVLNLQTSGIGCYKSPQFLANHLRWLHRIIAYCIVRAGVAI